MLATSVWSAMFIFIETFSTPRSLIDLLGCLDVIRMETFSSRASIAPRILRSLRSQVPRSLCHRMVFKRKGRQRQQQQQLTYRQVNDAAERLSQTLSCHIRGESVVAVFLPRTNECVYVAQLAAMKAGAAYLCIDHVFPDERITFTLSDASPSAIVTNRDSYPRLKECIKDTNISIIVYEDWEKDDAKEDFVVYNIDQIEESRLAYIIYTSGSTGQPKGVLIEHRNISNSIRANLSYFSKSVGSGSRIGQNSSVAYDSSVEEIYLAFAFGGTCIILDDDVIRMGPDLPSWLIKERINVLSPCPTLLRTMGARASSQLTDLKLLYVGGEELPKDVADVWSRGRQLENGYGPTECAVTVTRCPVHEGLEVTIGKPVANNTAWILDEKLNPVAPGESGELCISGASVARGYLNREKLTAEKFYQHPVCGRIYRTGDLVEQRPAGDLLYHGRIDSQVKLRGYRIELSSIESHLSSEEDVSEAACVVQEHGTVQKLVAFLTSKASATVDVKNLKAVLTKVLPPYMVPSEFHVLKSLPRQISGKIDRKALAKMNNNATPKSSPTHRANGNHQVNGKIPFGSPIEQFMAEVIMRHLGLDHMPSATDDFFEVGGDSLTAAIVISEFRDNPRSNTLAVRDIYEQRTIQALASICIKAENTVEAADLPILKKSNLCQSPFFVTLFQFLWILSHTMVGAASAYFPLIYPWRFQGLTAKLNLAIMPVYAILVFLLFTPLSILWAATAKCILIGRYKPGRYPIWGCFYLRHWICQGYIRLIPWNFITGTIFQIWALRLLGAKIGKRVHIHRGVNITAAWDLLTIGDDVTIGRDAALRMLDFENHEIVIGEITIGDHVTMATRAGVSSDTSVGKGAYISALSVVTPGHHVPSGAYWEGVPGKVTGRAPDVPKINRTEHVWSPVSFAFVFMIHDFLFGLLTSPYYLVFVYDVFNNNASLLFFTYTIQYLVAIIAGCAFVGLVLMALYCRLLGKLKKGVYHDHSTTFMKATLKDIIVQRSGNYLSGTLFWPLWLRLAGMQIGRGCEVSRIMEVIPELVSIGDECFFADGIYLGSAIMHGGTATLNHLSFGSNTFLGNHVVCHAGSRLPSDILIGICTVANPEKIRTGTSWFGNPSFQLQRREVVEVDRSLTHRPSLIRYIDRLFWELLRFIIPLPTMLLYLVWTENLLLWRSQYDALLFYAYLAPLLTILSVLSLLVGVILLKWILIGRMREGQHVLWSCWCSRWDFLHVAWGAWAQPILAFFEGSLMLNSILRLFGVNIGKRVFLGPRFSQVTDPDLLHFEDHSTVVCNFQAHSFEDRVLKKAPLHIRRGATVGSGVVMMYGADVGEGAIVGEHSVVMKQEVLLPKKYYVGCPTRASNQHFQSGLIENLKGNIKMV